MGLFVEVVVVGMFVVDGHVARVVGILQITVSTMEFELASFRFNVK